MIYGEGKEKVWSFIYSFCSTTTRGECSDLEYYIQLLRESFEARAFGHSRDIQHVLQYREK